MAPIFRLSPAGAPGAHVDLGGGIAVVAFVGLVDGPAAVAAVVDLLAVALALLAVGVIQAAAAGAVLLDPADLPAAVDPVGNPLVAVSTGVGDAVFVRTTRQE